MGCLFLLQGICPTQGSNPGLLYWQVDFFFFFLPLSHLGSPVFGIRYITYMSGTKQARLKCPPLSLSFDSFPFLRSFLVSPFSLGSTRKEFVSVFFTDESRAPRTGSDPSRYLSDEQMNFLDHQWSHPPHVRQYTPPNGALPCLPE